MDIFNALLPSQPILWPALFVAMIYGVRYIGMASIVFLFARPTNAGGWGRPHANAPASFETARHVRRELMYSLVTVLAFGLVNAVLLGWGLIYSSLLYFRISDYPAWWFWLSIPAMLFLHDTLFYWMHRAMHTRLLFGVMHKVHHLSVHPTAFASYSFHPTEAIAEALIVTALLFIIPVHPLALLVFQTISTAYNVYGHCGREFYPAGTASHWLGRWLNTSTSHASHHVKGRLNYGLYFMFWDRLMKTADPPYK